MERREPEFSPDEPIEFRPRSYRGPTRQQRSQDEYFYLKVSVGVGLAVLVALLIFNAFDRYQDRKDAEFALKQLRAELAHQNAEDEKFIREHSIIQPYATPERAKPRPLAPDERCINGDRLRRVNGGWQQLPREPC